MNQPADFNPRHLQLEHLASQLSRQLSCALGTAPCRTPECDGRLGRLFCESAEQLHAELQAVNHALARLNRGLGEICECCGHAIDAARLRDKPQATRCRSCEQAPAAPARREQRTRLSDLRT